MRPWRGIGLCAITIGLAACSGMSQNECQLADWQAVGYEDGARGQATEALGARRQACAKHGVTPDFSAYQAGRHAGLQEYCQARRGFNEGRRGAQYSGVCPAGLEADFLDGYTEGRTLYQLEYSVRSTARQIRYNEGRIKEIDRELSEIATSVLVDTTTTEERAQMLIDTKELAGERMKLSSELPELEYQLENQQAELAAHEAQRVTRY